MEYWLIEIILAFWIVLIAVLNQKLINKYPLGLSRTQAEINSSRSFFYLVLSFSLCCLIYFSSWLASWSNKLATTLSSTSLYFADQLADFLCIINLSLSASLITSNFVSQKRDLFIYQNLFGLEDLLPKSSLDVISSLPLSKQTVLAERLSWVVEKAEKNAPFQLKLLFDKEELIILDKIFSDIDINNLDYRLVPIYQEVNKLASNPKPFSIIL